MHDYIPLRREVIASAEHDAVFASSLIRRGVDEVLLRSAPCVQIIGPRGSGKTALVYSFFAKDAEFRVLRGWEVPSTPQLLESWVAENSQCRTLLVDDAHSAPEADVTVLVRATLNRSMRVVVTSTHRLHIPGAADITLLDLTTNEAEQILTINNALSTDRKLPSHVIQELASAANRLRTPRALVMAAIECLRHPTKSVREVLSVIDGELYEFSRSKMELPKAREIIVDTLDGIIKQLRRHPQGLFQLPPRRLEEIVAEILRDRGCEVHLTPCTRDGGLDLYASYPTPLGRMLCLVEVKRYRPDRPVTVELVRQLYGTFCAHDANSAMLVTTSRFTEDAQVFQRRFQQVLDLREYLDLTEWLYAYGNTHTAP